MPEATSAASVEPVTAGPRKPYEPPAGAERVLRVQGVGPVRAEAGWLLVREHGVPRAEVFFTSYRAEGRGRARRARSIMFLFNGGPGAASAFLHVGTAGPLRVDFTKDGSTLPPPAKVVPNADTWLRFADLVFVDPVGTGLSRTLAEARLEREGFDPDEEKTDKRAKAVPDAAKGFFKLGRDIDVLTEFVSAFLSRHRRWDSPVFIAGESYGGFRVGKLMRALPERGVGLCGAIMVSPAIDFHMLAGSDYDVQCWVAQTPTMALAAAHHGKIRGRFAGLSRDRLAAAALAFAIDELAPMLLRGDLAPAADRSRVLATLADLIGLPRDLVERCAGRVLIDIFARELLRAEGLLCGLYDAAVTGPNVFPDREGEQTGPDPTLAGITPTFTAGVNTVLRSTIGLDTPREYHLMNHNAWKQWVDERRKGYWERQPECADDARYGLAAVPGLRLLVLHGFYDLVTTFTSSALAVASLRLPPALRSRVSLTNYPGGHMFYTWEGSRRAVCKDVGAFVAGR